MKRNNKEKKMSEKPSACAIVLLFIGWSCKSSVDQLILSGRRANSVALGLMTTSGLDKPGACQRGVGKAGQSARQPCYPSTAARAHPDDLDRLLLTSVRAVEGELVFLGLAVGNFVVLEPLFS